MPTRHTDEEVLEAAKGAPSVTAVMVRLGLKPYGYAHARFRDRLHSLGIHIDPALAIAQALKAGNANKKRRTIHEYLVLDGPAIATSKLRRWLIKLGLKKAQCEKCNRKCWMGQPINFHLDHIDGNNKNCVIDNLRILCPNCHSMTPTYAKIKEETKAAAKANWTDSRPKCISCETRLGRKTKTKLCMRCGNNARKSDHSNSRLTDLNRVARELGIAESDEAGCVLHQLIWLFPMTTLAGMLNVSDRAINKWCNKFGVEKPGVGYWSGK